MMSCRQSARELSTVGLLMLVGCAVAVPANAPVNTWTKTNGIASSTPELRRREVPVPGRRDIRDRRTQQVTITGYCPPRADVYSLADGRRFVVRNQCAGPTELSVHDGQQERPVTTDGHVRSAHDGRVWQVSNRHVLFYYARGWWAHLLLIDLDQLAARRLSLPSELHQVKNLEVGVAKGHIFVGGGKKRIAVGGGGCENPPPNMGCDPVPVYKTRDNDIYMLYRPGPTSGPTTE